MTDRMDAKYLGTVYKHDGTIVPDDEWIVFRAQDDALPAALWAYLIACTELGASDQHRDSVSELIGRVEDWRANNPDKCKTPD